MAFRALLFSRRDETNTAMAAACAAAGIHVEVCSDIFTAIEKGKTRVFSCVIADWADQPEASFLLKRARESTPNRDTVAIAVVDHEPTPAELRESRLDFLVSRPVSANEAHAVLTKACEKMQPMSAEDAREAFDEDQKRRVESPSIDSAASQVVERVEQNRQPNFAQKIDPAMDHKSATAVREEDSHGHKSALGIRAVLAAALVLVAAFLLWSSRDVVLYLTRTPEGKLDVLRESVAALFYSNKTGASPVLSAGSDAQQDAYFSRDSSSNGRTVALKVAATESTLTESRIPLPKASDFPLPSPLVQHEEVAPVHIAHAAIPDSMKNSEPIERPIVVTVSPALMMPVSIQSQPAGQPAVQSGGQPVSEPVALSEDAARALLVHVVNPVYPPEGSAQKLHGPVVLQAVIGRDGSVQDVKIVRGYFILGRAAIAAVKQWRFQPYNLNGHAAATQTLITINFGYPPG
jgi:TonB family protein